jgi:hypothetical protein
MARLDSDLRMRARMPTGGPGDLDVPWQMPALVPGHWHGNLGRAFRVTGMIGVT